VSHGNLELSVGRIVGDTAADMLSLFHGGLSGPVYGSPPRAVLASWDGGDLDFCCYSDVAGHVEDWGFSASRSMVDNSDWREDDLLHALSEQFSLFIHSDHGWPYGICAPPDKVNVTVSEITGTLFAASSTQYPFYGFMDCRVGFTLVDDGLIDGLIHEGASGFVAAAGIGIASPGGTEWCTEEVFNNFWRRAIPEDGTIRSVGHALRKTKADYDPDGGVWWCWDRKAVMQLTLFGVPWNTIPAIEGTTTAGVAASRSRDQAAPGQPFSVPQATLADAYVITVAVDVSSYSITRPVPGFDLVEVDGFQQAWLNGPMLPSKDLGFSLPPGAEITSVEVQFGQETSLGTLNVPTYTPGVPLYPDGRDPVWGEMPQSVGIVPTEPYTYDVREHDTHLVAHVHVIPVTYDAASDQATLYQQIVVTVGYTTPVAIALTDLYLGDAIHAPGERVDARAKVVNVTDAPAVFTTTLTLVDVYGAEVSVTAGGPFTVPAGASAVVTPTAQVPGAEGTYSARLALWQDGVPVTQAGDAIHVVAVQITAFEGPDSVIPGQTAVFTVTLANYTASSLEAGLALDLATEWGEPVAALTSPTQTVPAGGQVTAPFAWDGTAVPSGRYQATARVTPAGHSEKRSSRLFQVRHVIYLRSSRAVGNIGSGISPESNTRSRPPTRWKRWPWVNLAESPRSLRP